jgi:hypothetical protein
MKSKNRKQSFHKKIKLLILCLSVFSLTFSVAKANQPYPNILSLTKGGDWVKYFSKPGNVEIYFPVQYENSFKETPDGKVTTITAKNGDTDYLLIWTILKDNTSGYEASKAAMVKFKDSYKGDLKEEEKYKEKKCEGVKALIVIPDKNITINYQVIIVNKIMYQLAVFSPTANINKKDMNKFMKSFNITD